METLEKDKSIITTLEQLQHRFGNAFTCTDHWDADLMAIGITNPACPGRLVYFSTYNCAPDQYYVATELPSPPNSDLPYEPDEKFDDVDFEKLVLILAQHLDLRML